MARYSERSELAAEAIKDLATSVEEVLKILLRIEEGMKSQGLTVIRPKNLVSGKKGLDALAKFVAEMEEAFILAIGHRNIQLTGKASEYVQRPSLPMKVAEAGEALKQASAERNRGSKKKPSSKG